MRTLIRSHRELDVFQAAMEAQRMVFRLTRGFPPAEQFGLTAQMLNSSRSVCAAIGEAWRKRRYPKHWASKLTDSESEAAETQIWLDISFDCGYISAHDLESGRALYERILAQLVVMASNPQQWVIPFRKQSTARRSPTRTLPHSPAPP